MSQLQRAVSIVALCCGIILPHIVRPESPSVRDQVRQSVLTADVVVYTASPGGVAAAIAAAREGASVILVEPDPYIGGIIAQGGLCISDVGKTETIGGLARNFFDRVAAYYADKYGEKSVQLRETVIRGLKGAAFEPKVAEQVFEEMLTEYPSVTVIRNMALSGVEKHSGVIRAVHVKERDTGRIITITGNVFIDGGYTADLTAKAGVSYFIGTEGKSVFSEPSAPEKSSPAIQAFNYRVTLTSDPVNRLPITKPAGYDPDDYLIRLSGILKDSTTKALKSYWRLPNRKMDANLADFPGENWHYPEADDAERRRIEERHRKNSLGYIYFLQQDNRVPLHIREEVRAWGLPKDEFTDNGHFPRHIYIREGRRLNGSYVLKQQDLQEERKKHDAIALGSYAMDSHATMVVTKADGTKSYGGGGLWEPVKPYEIAYRALVPKPEECTNLLVPVCLSSSHMAWTSIRMEPVFMMTGEAAGIAAAMVAATKAPVQQIDVKALQSTLLRYRAIPRLLPEAIAGFEWFPRNPKVGEQVVFTVTPPALASTPARYFWDFDGDGKVDGQKMEERITFQKEKLHLVSLVVQDSLGNRSLPVSRFVSVGGSKTGDVQLDAEDEQFVSLKGASKSNSQKPYWGTFFHTDKNRSKGKSYASYFPPLKNGKYAIYLSTAPTSGRSPAVPVIIEHAGGKETVMVNQQSGDPLFGLVYLGTFSFNEGEPARVTIRNDGTRHYIIYDVVRWIQQ